MAIFQTNISRWKRRTSCLSACREHHLVPLLRARGSGHGLQPLHQGRMAVVECRVPWVWILNSKNTIDGNEGTVEIRNRRRGVSLTRRTNTVGSTHSASYRFNLGSTNGAKLPSHRLAHANFTQNKSADATHHVPEVFQLQLDQASLQSLRVPQLDGVRIGLELVPS